MFKLTSIAAVACASALFLSTTTTQAAGVTNGDFSAIPGLSGWSVLGNVAVDTTSSFGSPATGYTAQAVLGTADTTSFLFGGSVAGAAALNTFAGLSAGTLTGLGGLVGSALLQTVTTGAGEALAFQWKFMTNEPQNSPSNDLAFVVIDGKLSSLTSVQTATLVGFSLSPLLDETAYTGFTSAPLSAGAHTLAFGIIDIPDSLGASALAISGVNISAVPEPGSWLLLLTGAAVMGWRQRRRDAAFA
jgi:hypothetical protein